MNFISLYYDSHFLFLSLTFYVKCYRTTRTASPEAPYCGQHAVDATQNSKADWVLDTLENTMFRQFTSYAAPRTKLCQFHHSDRVSITTIPGSRSGREAPGANVTAVTRKPNNDRQAAPSSARYGTCTYSDCNYSHWKILPQDLCQIRNKKHVHFDIKELHRTAAGSASSTKSRIPRCIVPVWRWGWFLPTQWCIIDHSK